jgi:hypothetical protein
LKCSPKSKQLIVNILLSLCNLIFVWSADRNFAQVPPPFPAFKLQLLDIQAMGWFQIFVLIAVAKSYPVPVVLDEGNSSEEDLMVGEPVGVGAYIRATYYPPDDFRHLTSYKQLPEAVLVVNSSPRDNASAILGITHNSTYHSTSLYATDVTTVSTTLPSSNISLTTSTTTSAPAFSSGPDDYLIEDYLSLNPGPSVASKSLDEPIFIDLPGTIYYYS